MQCITCGEDKPKKEFYSSASVLHREGLLPYCKACLKDRVGSETQQEVMEVLRSIDRPFILKMWESAKIESMNSKRGEEYLFGNYMKRIASPSQKGKTWADSEFYGMEDEVVKAPENYLSNDERNKLVKLWGVGHKDELLVAYQNKYNQIKVDYKAETTMHEEALKSYCIYKVKGEVALAEDDFDNAKKLGDLAQKQGEIAKINVNKLSASDLAQGIDGFSDLARKVEEGIDVVPYMTSLLDRPQDEVDYAIYFYVDYLRRLEGKSRISYDELYGFYQRNLEEMIRENPHLKKNVKKKLIRDSLTGKTKQIIEWDIDPTIEELQLENPNSAFYKNFKSWAEIVAYFRWYPDKFYDFITPEKGGITLGVDQRILLRALARFKFNMGVFSRGYGKCVVGDTLINTTQGFEEMGSFFNYIEDGKEQEFHDLCERVLNENGEVEVATKGIYSGFHQTLKFNTKLGHEIEVSLEHPLLTLNEDKEKVWKRARDITTEDILISQRGGYMFGVQEIPDGDAFLYAKTSVCNLHTNVLQANRESLKRYFKHLITLFGEYKGSNIELVLGSSKVAKQCQLLLLALGFISKRKRNILILDRTQPNHKEKSYIYQDIEGITKGYNHIYDLQVPITNSYNGNGFINHNTMLQNMSSYHNCIFYPNIKVTMTAQTQDSSASLLLDKYKDILNMYPYLKTEILEKETSTSQKDPRIVWRSGAIYDSLANHQNTKGQRRERLTMEESAQVNQKVFADAMEPIVNIPRRTVGNRAMTNPYELNGAISRFTTSWYRNTNEYDVSLRLKQEMIDLKGTFTLGASWELPSHFKRGESRSAILRKKETSPPSEFAMNYSEDWIGVTSGALVDIQTVMSLRGLEKAELQGDPQGEYYLGIDVARSESDANNKTMVVVAKVNRNADGFISTVDIVNMINIPATQNMRIIAQDVMKIKALYNPRVVVVDGNGLGIGLVDELVNEQIDPSTRKSLGCWKTINTEHESQLKNAEEILYVLKSQSINHEIIVNFMDYIGSGVGEDADGKLSLLTKKQDVILASEEVNIPKDFLPFWHTDRLLDELSNLKLKEVSNKRFTVEQQTRKIDKDRYSALAYVLWYIDTFENDFSEKIEDDVTNFFFC